MISVSFCLMCVMAVNAISFEEIELYAFFHKYFEGNAHWSEWFALQSNHRIFLNRILYFINLYLGGQILSINIVSFILVIFSTYYLRKIIQFQNPQFTQFILVSFMFSWFQDETFVHAHTINFNQEILLSTLFFYSLRYEKMWLSLVSLILSMFTMLSWGLLVPILLFELFTQKKWSYLPLVLISFVGIYIYRVAPSNDLQFGGVVTDPSKFIPFYLSLTGSLFGNLLIEVKFLLGGLITLFSIFAFIKGRKWEKVLIYWGVGHFVMISLGRSKYSLAGADLARYVSYGSVLYAILSIFALNYFIKFFNKKKEMFVTILFLFFYCFSLFIKVGGSLGYKGFKENGLNCVNSVLRDQKVGECHPYPMYFEKDYKKVYDFYKKTQELGFATPGVVKINP